MSEKYYTTGQFRHCGQEAYHKHCGPTAITNLVATLAPAIEKTPEEIFTEVANIGKKSLLYWNIDDKKWLGGTSDGLAGWYIRWCLTHFKIAGYQVRGRGRATPAKLIQALSAGHLVFLQLHFHKKYHQHHVLVYGHAWAGFRTADGWSSRPVYLGEKDLSFALFYEIRRC